MSVASDRVYPLQCCYHPATTPPRQLQTGKHLLLLLLFPCLFVWVFVSHLFLLVSVPQLKLWGPCNVRREGSFRKCFPAPVHIAIRTSAVSPFCFIIWAIGTSVMNSDQRLAVRYWDVKQTGVGSSPLRLSFLIKSCTVVSAWHRLVTLSLTINEASKWLITLITLPILMQNRFGGNCSVRNGPLSPPPPPPGINHQHLSAG